MNREASIRAGAIRPAPFSRLTRALEADGFRGPRWTLALAFVLLGAWTLWFFFTRVGTYEYTEVARLEANHAPHPIEAVVSGRVVSAGLALQREVRAGEVLVELDPSPHRLQSEEERRRTAALAQEIDSLREQLSAEKRALSEELEGSRAALEEMRAKIREEEVSAELSLEEEARYARLREEGLLDEIRLMQARAEVKKRRAAVDGLRSALARLEREQKARSSDREARMERIGAEITRLAGERNTTAAVLDRLENEIERHRLRAPIDGRIGEVSERIRVGAFVEEGERLAAIVPPGNVLAVAEFSPASLGRLRAGQRGQLRLRGFPWAQYGSLPVVVASVANELRDGKVRVELGVEPAPETSIPVQHGLPGSVEIEVERVSPATLVLRAAGRFVAQ